MNYTHNQNMKPLVSICIPTYNGANYLAECLDTVLSQSFSNFQVIIVDDQSSDDTWNILNQYAVNDNRISLFRNEHNLGLVGNWNRCIELADGEWVKFVHQDDVIKPDCLKLMMDATESGSQFIVCWRDFIYSEEVDNETKKIYMALSSLHKMFGNSSFISPIELAKVCLSFNGMNFIGEPTNTLFNKSIVKKYGLFNSNFIQLCDIEYWLRVGLNEGIKVVPVVLTRFRVHGNSTSTKNRNHNHFRATTLERLIFLHEFAYNPFYSILKTVKTNTEQKRNLKREFATSALRLKNLFLEKEKSNNISVNDKIHWNELVMKYPKIENSFYLIPIKIKRWVDQRILWRLKL